jgi:antirestriction protein
MEIKIYVANLGKYNDGELVGNWFTLPYDIEEMMVEVGVAHYDEDGEYVPYVIEKDEQGNEYWYEEVAIHDYEAPFNIGEYDRISNLNEIAERLESLSSDDEEILEMLLETGEFSLDDGIDEVENGNYMIYHNCDDMSDVAYQWYEETGGLSEIEKVISASYIDWERIGRDMEIEGSFYYVGNSTYIQLLS